MKHRWIVAVTGIVGVVVGIGCARIEVAPIEVKPIHITMDINLKIDRSLDDFFSYQNKPAGQPAVVVPTPTTIPSKESK